MKVTNEVLAEGIRNLDCKVDELRQEIKDNILPEIKAGAEFRQKTIGIVAFVGFVASVFGGAIIWLFNKFWGKS